MFYSLPPVGSKIYFTDIFKSLRGSHTNPHVIENFKEALRKYFSVKRCFLINSGRAALTATLMALKQGDDRDEVIIPSYTCFSVPAAIVRAGLKIGLCDIEFETLDFNYNQLEECITEKTLAIVPCHLFGLVCDMSRVTEIAKTKKVWVIEDAAQAMGAKLKGRYVGTIGDVGVFSLGRGKPMTTMGGGIIVANNDYLSDKISTQIESLIKTSKLKAQHLKYVLHSFIYSIFLHPWLYWIPEMLPFLRLGETIYDPNFHIAPFTDFQAQQGLIALKRLEGDNIRRIEKGIRYASVLGKNNGAISPAQIEGANPIFLRYPVLMQNKEARNEAYERMKTQGLGSHFMYPFSIAEIDGISSHLNLPSHNEKGKEIAGRLLTLPTHDFMTENQIKKISKILS